MTDESFEPSTTDTSPAEQPRPARRGRRIATGAAAVLAVALFLVATVGVWAKTTVLSTDRVVAAVDRAAEDPAVVDALSSRITEQIVGLVDVTALVSEVLPDGLDRLAPIINAAVVRVVDDQVTAVVSSDAGRKLLEEAVRVAHGTAVRLLQGDGLAPDSVFTVVDGEVRLDTVPLLVLTVEQLQERGVISDRFDLTEVAQNVAADQRVQALSRIFGVTVPDDFGQITLLDSARVDEASATLATAQRALAIFQRATALLVVLALVLVAVAMWMSLDRRRTLVQLAAGIGVGAVVLRIGIDKVVDAVDRAIDKAGAKAAAVNITESLTESLARTLVTLAIVGISVAVVAHLLRRTGDGGDSWLTTLVSTHADLARVVVVAVSIALLIAAGVTWVSLIIVVTLCVAGVLYVNRHAASSAV